MIRLEADDPNTKNVSWFYQQRVERNMNGTVVRQMGIAVLAVMMIGGLSGCGKKQESLDTDSSSSSAGNRGGNESTSGTGLPDIDESTLFGDAGLEILYFDYNSYTIRADAMTALRRNADLIRQVPGVIIQIEGHCDERGTQEYNLALGEKRALATRQALMDLGISGDRMVTISYGEEDPADGGHSESAWSRNRRSEFNKAL
jgi:peptidoglycan-associated lipoprotein